MAKPSLTTVATTQTFQNWLEKTNEMVNLFKSDALTASGGGDTTVGNATLTGTFQAVDLKASNVLSIDTVNSFTASTAVTFNAPISVTGTTNIVATLNFGASGGRARFTNGSLSWDAGINDNATPNFIITSGGGAPQLSLSTAGTLTVPNVVVSEALTIGTDLTVTGVSNFVGGFSGLDTSTVPEASGATFSNNLQYHSRSRVHDAISAGSNIVFTDIANEVKRIAVASVPTFTTLRVIDGTASAGFDGSDQGFAITTRSSGNGWLDETEAFFQIGYTDPAGTSQTPTSTGTSILTDVMKLGRNNATLMGQLTVLGVNGIRSSGRLLVGSSSNQVVSSSAFYSDLQIRSGTNTTIAFDAADGTIIAEGDITAFGSASDLNLKENIEVIPDALDKLNKISGYTFNYKDKPKEKMTGLIAQEVEEILPGVVYHVENDNKTSFKALRYGNVVGLLVEAIKELQAKVDDLEKKCSCDNE